MTLMERCSPGLHLPKVKPVAVYSRRTHNKLRQIAGVLDTDARWLGMPEKIRPMPFSPADDASLHGYSTWKTGKATPSKTATL
jgi:hypothetical protein